MSKYYIALDIGGTEIKSAAVSSSGVLAEQARSFPARSRESRDIILSNITDIITLSLGPEISGIGIGFPGPFDYENGISRMRGIGPVNGIGKYDALFGFPLGEYLRDKFSLPVIFKNDADLYSLGEYYFGQGRGSERMLCICAGTGLGSGFVNKGVLEKQVTGITGDGWIYHLPFLSGIADDYLSASGLQRLIRQYGHIAENGKELFLLAREGDESARKIFLGFGDWFAEFIPPLFYKYNADRLVVGGQVAGSFEFWGKALEKCLPKGAVRASNGGSEITLAAVSLLF